MIFHLAAQMDVRVSVARPVFDATVNILGSLNVFEGAVAAGVKKVVFAGSGGTLYGTPEKLPDQGDGRRSTRSRRTASPRRRSATTSTTTGRQHGLEYTVLALANVYGPRQNPHGEAGVVAIFADKLLDRERPMIFGDGSQTRDFVYVDDVVDAFVRAVDKGGGLTMNIGTGVETSVQQLYDVMAKLTGFREPPDYKPARAGELQRSALDPGPRRDPPRLEAVHDARGGPRPHPRALQGPCAPARAERAGAVSYGEAADLVERYRRPCPADVRGIGMADEHERVRQPFGRERERVAGLFRAEDRRRDPTRREPAVGRG